MKNIINFIKYHNAFTIILGLVLLATASVFANEDARNTVIGEKVEIQQGIDNSQLLAADLNNFDLTLKITNLSEDEDNYYVNYTYQTLGIRDNVWQPVAEEKTLTVSKNALGNEDLGLYVQKELSEAVAYQLDFLKRVQADESQIGMTKMTASVDYTGLIGVVLDIKNKILSGYTPMITKEVCDNEDNDKDGLIDEDLGKISCGGGACYREADACVNGISQICVPGTPAMETCDGIDNNCDGRIDEDGICAPPEQPPIENPPVIPEPPVCQPAEEICDGADNNCDGQIDEGGVCGTTADTESTSTEPTATSTEPVCQPSEETCDGLDNNCDGQIDENCDCGETFCDANLNLIGSCENSCTGISGCVACAPQCGCVAGFFDCNGDSTGSDQDGCESAQACSVPADTPLE